MHDITGLRNGWGFLKALHTTIRWVREEYSHDNYTRSRDCDFAHTQVVVNSFLNMFQFLYAHALHNLNRASWILLYPGNSDLTVPGPLRSIPSISDPRYYKRTREMPNF